MIVLRRVLVALLLTGLLAVWVAPASAEEIPPSVPDGSTAAPTPAEPPAQDPAAPEAGTPTDQAPEEPAGPGTEAPVDPGTEQPDLTVAGVELRWGLNHESNNRAFAPGTFNFFAAGKVADPGAGGQTLTTASGGAIWSNGRAAGWSASSGNVSIEKWNTQTYQAATWAGLSTDETGATIPSPTSGKFSGHQIVFANGTGEIDPLAGTMSVAWDGDATVLYYSGMTFFYLSDPQLEIAGGTGTLTAELSGFTSSMEDLTQWGPVAPRRVTVATFSSATLPADGVATLRPDYAGSWPAEFLAFQEEAGAAAYWYQSGGSADALKVPLDVTVLTSPDAAPPVPPVPAGNASQPVNSVLPAPPRLPAPRLAAPAIAPVAAVSAAGPPGYRSAGDHGWMLGRTPVSDQLVWWLLAAGLLTMTASTATVSAVYVRRLRPSA